MKITKTATSYKITMTQQEWASLGKKAGFTENEHYDKKAKDKKEIEDTQKQLEDAKDERETRNMRNTKTKKQAAGFNQNEYNRERFDENFIDDTISNKRINEIKETLIRMSEDTNICFELAKDSNSIGNIFAKQIERTKKGDPFMIPPPTPQEMEAKRRQQERLDEQGDIDGQKALIEKQQRERESDYYPDGTRKPGI